ncbi:hypothetical protein X566_12315 [Afipia sp. P52-10]|uniref:hypothetical protein n=1 Tax=Afipia sp. P52-10 TaxID=1429916 RepID=UPI0003DF36BB|nr:hypothetical protein [Afipia sp. P52-10]ETR79100.1 hypothetical protein X566_12315 [Afipia sp. P52-10]
MPAPTKFQFQLHYDAMQLLIARGIAFQNETVERPTDLAIQLTFRDVALWIFKDGVTIRGGGVDRAFESSDFKNLEALKAACLDYLKTLPQMLPTD